jgi:2-dehydro-3-deoxyphosphogluconate aldolase/(4S)-4-hydroxy-2-oxoglutarate aldolase
VVIDRLDDAVPLADALLQGGVSALEITLRTPVACEAISAMKSALPHAIIGAGTVSSGEAYETAVQSGADFIVSPGATDQLFKTATAHAVPFLPGAVTGSEVLRAMELGYATLKFFPAEAAGGPSTLQALSGPFPGINFMPTGGVTPHNSVDLSAASKCLCCGRVVVDTSRAIDGPTMGGRIPVSSWHRYSSHSDD